MLAGSSVIGYVLFALGVSHLRQRFIVAIDIIDDLFLGIVYWTGCHDVD